MTTDVKIMNTAEPIAILSDITANQLECTAHCPEYQCMLRMKSVVTSPDSAVGVPDVFSLCAIPIMSNEDMVAAGYLEGEIVAPLLPKNNDVVMNLELGHHPCSELLRIARHLEKQLHERLNDASNGVTNNMSDEDVQPGIYEEFLQSSEAVIKEFLAAIQQHLRKEQTGARAMNSNNNTSTSTSSMSGATECPPLTYYTALLKQLKELERWPNVTDINVHDSSKDNDEPTDIIRLSVTSTDREKRSHTWHAELYPSIVLTVDLPNDFVLVDNNLKVDKWWDGNDKKPVLPEIQRRFHRGVTMYQPLFDELDELDSYLWILEPSLPARRCSVERRIALWEGGASLVIVLDPEKPRAPPVLVRFVGLTAAAMKAAQNTIGDDWTKNGKDWSASFAQFVAEGDNEDSSQRWSERRSVKENLELWFGAPLPSPLSSVKSDFLVECGICYTHRLPIEDVTTNNDPNSEEGALPEVKCTCNRHYHESCLFEWLHSLPTAKNSFDRIFGSCPYCCETVSVTCRHN